MMLEDTFVSLLMRVMLKADGKQGEENEENAQVSTTTKNASSLYQHEREALTKAFQQEYSLSHTDKRSRTDMIAGQEVGQGVIGSTHTPLHAITAEGKRYMAKVIEGEHGCDTPIYTFEDARRGIAIPEGCLDPDLPPLAIEHPARMWNSLIHSLEPSLQPVVKWDYGRVEGGELPSPSCQDELMDRLHRQPYSSSSPITPIHYLSPARYHYTQEHEH